MIKNLINTSILLLLFFFMTFGHQCKASEAVKPIFNRAGLNNAVEENLEVLDVKKNVNSSFRDKIVTYSDSDLKKIVDEITADLNDEHDYVLNDLRILWQSAAERSETIKFAIYKLSNPEGEKANPSTLKKILSPMSSVAPIVGLGSGSAVLGSTSIFGGSLLNSVLSDGNEINHQLSRVTDADLVILAKDIDSLQQNLISLYYNYVSAMKMLQISDNNVSNRYKIYTKSQKSSAEVLAVADAYYREALDKQYNDRQKLFKTRAALEQVVGNDAIVAIEKDIKTRG